MKINGTPWVEIKNDHPFPSFTIYKVKLHSGPADGIETLAGNTTVVFHGRYEYRLNEEGDFVYHGTRE